MYHPRKNEKGDSVKIHHPSQPSIISTWTDSAATACVIPDGLMPQAINGLAITAWKDYPQTSVDWEALAETMSLTEPPFDAPAGLKKASGVVVREPDGRIWIVAPSNAFGGYKATFPKGRLEGKSAKVTALIEAFEESGLRVRLLGYLVDVARSTTYTRYYLAERVGGNPADMGWESQAVILAPLAELPVLLNSSNDLPIIEALKNYDQ
jgi:8-oxo-dGTP pyrophosphatase MutT (NUDIX family)